jgi:hypothetical protein
MTRTILIGFVPALLLHAQDPPALDEYLDALARTAATFAASAPGLMAEETLDQHGRRGFVEILKGKKDEIKDLEIKLPEDFRTHQVISSYALAEIGQSHALHEIRTVITMDGRRMRMAGDARRVLTTGLRSPDERTRRKLLEDLAHDQLEGAVTDFGQLILLFTKRLQKDYAFSLTGQQRFGEEQAVVLGYRQISGAQGLTFFKERTAERQPASGQIWLRQKDLLAVRIMLNTEERTSKELAIRTQATVDYIPSQFGLVPEHVVHRQFLNSSLMVENDLRYADFHHANPMIP